jgi:site-specific DNA-methyltransferase (adenine-specific)
MADHPSLKPQSFLRQLVYAALPLGIGAVTDTFMGSGSTIAAAEALGIKAVGVEKNENYFMMSKKAIPELKNIACPQIESLLGRVIPLQTNVFAFDAICDRSS